MLTLRFTPYPPRRATLLRNRVRPFVAVDLSGSVDDLRGLIAALSQVAHHGGVVEADVLADDRTRKLCIFRSDDAMAVLRTEAHLLVAGAAEVLVDFADRVGFCVQNEGNPHPIEGYHAHVEFFEADSEWGPAGEFTVFVNPRSTGHTACPPGCQPVG